MAILDLRTVKATIWFDIVNDYLCNMNLKGFIKMLSKYSATCRTVCRTPVR